MAGLVAGAGGAPGGAGSALGIGYVSKMASRAGYQAPRVIQVEPIYTRLALILASSLSA